MDHIIGVVTFLLLSLLGLVLEIIGFIDGLLSHALTAIGVPLAVQLPLLVIAAIILGVMALRWLGGLFAGLLLLLFLLLLLHPHMPHVWMHMPAPAPNLAPPEPPTTI